MRALWIVLVSAACSATQEGTTVVASPCSPSSLAVDDTTIYWTALCGSGSVRSAPKGGGPETVIAEGEHKPSSIALDMDSVFWETSEASGTIRAIPKVGGQPRTLATDQPLPLGSPGNLIASRGSLVWSNEIDKAVMQVSTTGGTPSKLATGHCEPFVAADAEYAYWIDTCDMAIYRSRRDSGAVPETLALVNAPATAIENGLVVTDDALFYWVDFPADEVTAVLYRLDKASLASRAVVDAPAGGVPPIAVDANFLYWSRRGEIVRLPLAGGEPESVAAVSSGEPGAIAVDDTYVYWTNDSGTGRILRAPK